MRLVLLLIFSSIFTPYETYSQGNLVPNPNFEIRDTCPLNMGQINYAIGWYRLNISPDYFSSCSQNQRISIPSNIFGYQNTVHSNENSYFGIITEPNINSIHEIFGINLSEPLNIGTRYFVSFLVSPSYITTNPPGNNIVCFCNKLGAKFFTQTIPTSGSMPQLIDNFSQVSSDTMYTDTTKWYNFNQSFIADSAYTFLCIGSFYTSGNMTCQCLNTLGTKAYYYIDNVCVTSDSTTCLVAVDDEPVDDEEIQIEIDDELHQINIHIKNPNNTSVEAFDAIGKLVMHKQLTSSDNYISYEKWASGVYLLRVGEKVFKLKLVRK